VGEGTGEVGLGECGGEVGAGAGEGEGEDAGTATARGGTAIGDGVDGGTVSDNELLIFK